MTTPISPAKGSLPVSPKFLCPFLGVREDADTYSASSDLPNYCHKARPVGPLTIDCQLSVCCTEAFERCPIYTSEKPRSLPPEWLRHFVHHKKKWNLRKAAAYILPGLVLIALISVLYRDRFSFFLAFASAPSATPTSVPSTATLEAVATMGSTSTPTLSLTSSPTVTLGATPSLTLTFTQALPTRGPGLETPFGSPETFVVHRVQEGESLNVIAIHYNTSVAVIKAMNYIKPGASLWPGAVLVMVPGMTDPAGLPQVTAVLLTSRTSVLDLAKQYSMDPALLRQYNVLGLGDWLEANRWVVVSYHP